MKNGQLKVPMNSLKGRFAYSCIPVLLEGLFTVQTKHVLSDFDDTSFCIQLTLIFAKINWCIQQS